MATLYPQWSKEGNGPGRSYGGSNHMDYDRVKSSQNRLALDVTVWRAQLQNASRTICRIDPMRCSFFGSSQAGKRFVILSKMQELHTNEIMILSPSLASEYFLRWLRLVSNLLEANLCRFCQRISFPHQICGTPDRFPKYICSMHQHILRRDPKFVPRFQGFGFEHFTQLATNFFINFGGPEVATACSWLKEWQWQWGTAQGY